MCIISILNAQCSGINTNTININQFINNTGTNINIKCSDILPLQSALNGIMFFISLIIAYIDRANLKEKIILKKDNEVLKNQNSELIETATRRGLSLQGFEFPINANNEPYNNTPATLYPENPTTNF